MMTKPIETVLGVLWGRDCIHIDEVNQDYTSRTIELIGEINASLTSNGKENIWTKYKFKFSQIYYFNMIELDLSDKYINYKFPETTSFFEIIESDLLKNIKEFRNDDLKHFVVQTYDKVFEIAAKRLEITIY